MRCPGQDRRYWKGDIAFEVPCPRCHTPMEFFKDENTGRCRACGHRLTNPKKSFDCAQWCAYAEECTGKAVTGSSRDESGFASRLFQAIDGAFPEDPRQAEALLVFQHAKELLADEGGDPRCVLPSAVLLPFYRSVAADQPEEASRERLVRILREIDLEQGAIEQVWTLLEAAARSEPLDMPEYRIVCDADRLARLSSETGSPHRTWEEGVQNDWNTDSAGKRARLLFQEGTQTDQS